jgi:hypothetical protein
MIQTGLLMSRVRKIPNEIMNYRFTYDTGWERSRIKIGRSGQKLSSKEEIDAIEKLLAKRQDALKLVLKQR